VRLQPTGYSYVMAAYITVVPRPLIFPGNPLSQKFPVGIPGNLSMGGGIFCLKSGIPGGLALCTVQTFTGTEDNAVVRDISGCHPTI